MKDRKSIKEMRDILKKRPKSKSKDVTVFTVELLMVADVSVKDRFMALYRKKDALGVLKTYFELIAFSVQDRFDSISELYPDTVVKIELSGIVIMNTTDDAPFCRDNIRKGYLQFDPALDDFAMWSLETEDLPPHDHAMWITDEILAHGRDTSTNGVSYIGMACTNGKVSIVEDYYTGRTGHIAAHELGHKYAFYF
ncbi:hypothetical protein LOTGIDRAFT_160889 [Lottia gigantea]|uniref:Peptidase M12B domain-containing protein n=1 Tax=Lottia gigantea TaxID=225164 RepID=V4AND3_LOTGI|nr:hypothetical protein LOTGIDRAFT_160889 [Lottia gigantea]ESO95126.1 hypothetical protein LOTGIDRAFT_160889 [Lottia gigantea]